jgi:hypothetical protein
MRSTAEGIMRSSVARQAALNALAPSFAASLAKLFPVIVILPLALMIAAPATGQSSSCLDTKCFYDRQIRDFTVIDATTVLVYIGSDRCPYLIRVNGSYCDMEFIPDIEFYSTIERRRDVEVRNRRDIRQRGFIRAGEDGFATNDRICPNNAFRFALETFGFGRFDEREVPVGVAACSVNSVEKVTDDDLIELYAEEGIAPPPPPIGNGAISRSGDSQ